jgi:hypothetical protein
VNEGFESSTDAESIIITLVPIFTSSRKGQKCAAAPILPPYAALCLGGKLCSIAFIYLLFNATGQASVRIEAIDVLIVSTTCTGGPHSAPLHNSHFESA